jgi:FADH2 O2-dependent halogenase
VIADFEVAIVGSGFAGSLLASISRRLGRSVALLERGTHPRFAIGESSSPLANVLLEEISRRYGLDSILPLTKWGSWRRERPELACGLKRGFSFFRHEQGREFAADPERTYQLLVAASPRDEIADTHWYRADFDQFLMLEALRAGAEYFDRTLLERFRDEGDGVRLEGTRKGAPFSLRARIVIDASGPRGFLSQTLGIDDAGFQDFPATQALFSHFQDVRRVGPAIADRSGPEPPYPVDDAALHHVFDGGWIWVLRFSNGLTSAGCAVEDWLAAQLRLEEGEPAWRRLLDRLPTVRAQFEDAVAVRPFEFTGRLAYRARRASGARWALLPSAASFVDPLLSTGIPLTLLGVGRMALCLEESWGSDGLSARLAHDAESARREADASAKLIAALYASFGDFPLFASLTMLYFAAASFAEAARRLGRPELAPGFLLSSDPIFAPRLFRCCDEAIALVRAGGASGPNRRRLLDEIAKTVAPVNVAGLLREERRNWYPVEAEDLIAGAGKLRSSREEIEAMLEKVAFRAPAGSTV